MRHRLLSTLLLTALCSPLAAQKFPVISAKPPFWAGLGRDSTIWALVDGHVKFDRNGRRVNVVPVTAN